MLYPHRFTNFNSYCKYLKLLHKISKVLIFLLILRYKERLQTKYLKAPTSRISSVGSCCLYDLSDGSSVLSGTQRGVLPVIFHGTPNHNSSQKNRKCISKEHACFSKQMIQKQVRREYLAAVEEKLKQHPLAMYPHYKDHMTPEVNVTAVWTTKLLCARIMRPV